MKNRFKFTIHNSQFSIVLALMMACPLAISAQDEEAAEENVVVIKQMAKPTKKYPMKEISGKVVDAITGEPLAGAQIKAYNNSYYTAMAGEDGSYTISVPTFVTSLSTVLEGYNMTRTAVNARTSGVVIGLYTDRFLSTYEAKTSASKSVETKGFGQSTAITADQEIQNRLGADVRTIQRSAIPGLGDAMFINGYNSLNSNAQPLIVLDGVVYDMMYDASMIHSGYYNNLLTAIAMDDIESIEVKKNGTAIYGAKAANGVIEIKTKRAKSMATRIDVNVSAGIELEPKLMDVMGAEDYRTYAAEMLQGTGSKLTDFKFLNPDPSYYYYNMYHNNTDWKDVSYKEAFTQNYGINISGGDDIASYNLSVGYLDSKSTLRNNKMDRFNIRFNTDIILSKWFSTRFDASYTNVSRNLRDDGLSTDYGTVPFASTGMLTMMKAPFLSPYDFSTDGKVSEYISDADTYLQEVLGTAGSLANPLGILENGEAKNKNHSDNTMVNIAITPKWEPTNNFSLQERFSYTMQSFNEEYYTPIVGMPDYTIQGKGLVNNTRESLYTKHNAVFSDTRFDWAIPLGAHRLDIFGGARFMNDTYTTSDLLGYNTGIDKTPNSSTSLAYKTSVGNDTEWRSLSYYANVDYNYKETYYLQGQVSMETSSRFGKNVDAGLGLFGVKWGIFPSIQGSWVITNEKWFHPSNGVNMLKVNVGFESVGNDNVDNSATLTYMSGFSMLQQAVTGMALSNIGNDKLRWETTNRFNAGIEGNFINNRLHLRFNYYKSKTSNLISLGTLAYTSGLHDYWTNDGALKNEGFDVTAIAKVINLKDFKMELGASVGHYKNKLTELPEGNTQFTTDLYGGTILSRIGSPVGLFYGYKTDGVYATTAEADAAGQYIVDNAGTKQYFGAGDMIFVDQNGDKCIDENDKVVIGDPNPDIYGNLFANFYIGKHWSVSARFSYSLGNDIYNYQRSILESGSEFINQTTALNRRWIAEGQRTDIPKATYGDAMGNSRFSDRWIEDGSYLKLKNVTVNYQIPIRNEYIQGLSIWAAANNLFTITKYLGNDPEVSSANGVLYQGIDCGYLSSGRSFMLGVKINL